MQKRLAFLAVLAACGGSKSSGPGQDWSGRPLDVKIADQVNNVAFTVQAPKGMVLDAADTAPDAIAKSWRADVDDYFSEPGFTIAYESIPPTDLAGFISDQMLDDNEVIVKKEATADGFVLLHHNKTKGLVYANVLKAKGEHHLECTASQAKQGGVPNFEKTMAWLEQLCSSLTIP